MLRITLLIGSLCGFLHADSFLAAHPETFISPSGKYIIRTEPADSVVRKNLYWAHTEFNIFAYDEESEAFTRVRKFEVEGHPSCLFINDEGTHIVTLDQHFGSGHGQIAVVYDFHGVRLGQWKLQDLFEEMTMARGAFSRFQRSTSSVFWRGEARWNHDQKKILIDPPKEIEKRQDGRWAIVYPGKGDSYEIDLEAVTMKRVPPRTKTEDHKSPVPDDGTKGR